MGSSVPGDWDAGEEGVTGRKSNCKWEYTWVIIEGLGVIKVLELFLQICSQWDSCQGSEESSVY